VKNKKAVLLVSTAILFFSTTAGYSKKGVKAFYASCCIGPRIGLELNEDKPIKEIEWDSFTANLFIPFLGNFISAIYQGSQNGSGGFFASCCLGPRVGEQLGVRRIRKIEWMRLVPVVNLVAAFIICVEAGRGRTMTEIEGREDLSR